MVGVSGAGVSAGVLSGGARAQYAAMGALRWQMLVNGLRSKLGGFELGARTVRLVLFGIGGVMLGTGTVMASYFLASGGQWRLLPIVFWAVGVLWLMIPMMKTICGVFRFWGANDARATRSITVGFS